MRAPEGKVSGWDDCVVHTGAADNSASGARMRLIEAGFPVPGDKRRSASSAGMLLRVALRNALFRVSDSNTALCPAPIFRALEAGEMGVGEATDRLEVLLRMLASGVAQANHEYDGDRP